MEPENLRKVLIFREGIWSEERPFSNLRSGDIFRFSNDESEPRTIKVKGSPYLNKDNILTVDGEVLN